MAEVWTYWRKAVSSSEGRHWPAATCPACSCAANPRLRSSARLLSRVNQDVKWTERLRRGGGCLGERDRHAAVAIGSIGRRDIEQEQRGVRHHRRRERGRGKTEAHADGVLQRHDLAATRR